MEFWLALSTAVIWAIVALIIITVLIDDEETP